jgi:hypothetical protein
MIIVMARNTSLYPERVYMAEISRELHKHRSTVITWDTHGWLPADLVFNRDDHGWRYWTRDQLERAREWVSSPTRRRAPRSVNAA